MGSNDSKFQAVVSQAMVILLDVNSPIQDRVSASSILGELAQNSAVSSLCEILADKDPLLQIAAAKALGRIYSRENCVDILDYLHNALRSPNSEISSHIATTLGEIGDPSSLNVLHEIFEHNSTVILNLLNAIELICSEESLVLLVKHKMRLEQLILSVDKAVVAIRIKSGYTNESISDILSKISQGVSKMVSEDGKSGSKYNFPKANVVQIIENNHGNVTAKTVSSNSESSEALEQLSSLLSSLRAKYPAKSDAEIFEILLNGFQTMPQKNPQNWQSWQNILSILFAGGVEGIKIVCPPAGIPIEVGKRLYDIYQKNPKQLPGN